MLSRRLFLAGSAAAALLRPRWASAQPSEAAWRALAEAGEVARPGDPGFGEIAATNNLRYDAILPTAIVRPADAGGVARALLWAQEQGMPFVLRSGGHSYCGASRSSGLVVDLRRLGRVTLLDDGTLQVAGGALNRQVAETLLQGGRCIVHGRCPGVGASAFLMGGGIGFAMRDHGLGCDLVQSAEVVLADGRLATASATENPELFWALRGGGGGNFAAVTGWRLATLPAEGCTVFRLVWDQATDEALWRVVETAEAAPGRLGSRLALRLGRHPLLEWLGQLRGGPEELRALFAKLPQPRDSHIEALDYWPAQDFLSEPGHPANYQETSHYAGRVPQALVEAVFRHPHPPDEAIAGFKMFHLGGRIRELPHEATSYAHRAGEWLAGSIAVWPDGLQPGRLDSLLAWQRDLHATIVQAAGGPGGSFVNFPDPGLADAAPAYYGDHLPRLKALRRRFDPEGLFRPPPGQGIAG